MSTDRSGDIHVTVQVSYAHIYTYEFYPPVFFPFLNEHDITRENVIYVEQLFDEKHMCWACMKMERRRRHACTHTHWIWNLLWIANRCCYTAKVNQMTRGWETTTTTNKQERRNSPELVVAPSSQKVSNNIKANFIFLIDGNASI